MGQSSSASSQSSDGGTLVQAALSKDFAEVKRLIASGADPKTCDGAGRPVLDSNEVTVRLQL